MKSEMVNLNCEVIRDLIPLCSEGLCSETSAQEIRKHIETCESCRLLYEQLPEMQSPASDIPDETRAFRKVRRKMKRSRIKIALLCAALLAVLIPVGYLTVGQIVKEPGIHSFETIWWEIEASRLARLLASGEIDAYMDKASYGDLLYLDSVGMQTPEMEAIRAEDTDNLKAAYEAAYGDTAIKSIRTEADYTHYAFGDTPIAYIWITVELDDGRTMNLHVTKGLDGLYSTFMSDNETMTEEEMAFVRALNTIENHELLPRGYFESLLTTKNGANADGSLTEGQIRYRMPGILYRLHDAYDAEVEESVTAFYKQGYRISNVVLSRLHYDEEKAMLYYDAVINAEDAQGTAVMQTRLYSTYEGLIPPEDSMTMIYTDGCTEALAEDLAKIFG